MIRVESITIKEFRGIRDLTIAFRRKNFAICGPNGTGKSGVVDALEFALTGNISRISGQGMGLLSLKQHAPHVDSRDHADRAIVTLTLKVDGTGKTVTIARSVKDANSPTITPNDQKTREILENIASHPEFVLSRRELIRYVISAPGDRAKEVQALLRLDQIEDLRAIFQKINNACDKATKPAEKNRATAADQLTKSLEISKLSKKAILDAVNQRRSILDLPPLQELTAQVSLKDGLLAGSKTATTRVPKAQAAADLLELENGLLELNGKEFEAARVGAIKEIKELRADSLAATNASRENILKNALKLVDDDGCPVCDTPWNPERLKAHIHEKLTKFEEIARKRKAIEAYLAILSATLQKVTMAIAALERHASHFKPPTDTTVLRAYKMDLVSMENQFDAFLPLDTTLSLLERAKNVPSKFVVETRVLAKAIASIPEPTKQDAARDFLTVGQERLETYREASRAAEHAKADADLARRVYETYAEVSTEVLNGIYKAVEKDFSELYREVNREDEDQFTARLVPSIGKLGFDVDFYGRGFFPPGAYHSEGHQDGMGLCLYLALMRYLSGDRFTFAVLDDVLMSVDSGHRREVCRLLKAKFPNTQFVLTTHDPSWLRHMSTEGLISSGAFSHFRKWDVDHGPTEWDDRDVWKEIEDLTNSNKISQAAGLIRNYLEYIAAELCNRLRARVEFRGDAQYQLGDLLPPVIGQFRKLLAEAKKAAKHWNQAETLKSVEALENAFSQVASNSNVEQWQINSAIHYNEWANLGKSDFVPVVKAQKALINSLTCGTCNGFLFASPARGSMEAVRCQCGKIMLNLKTK